MKIKHLLFAAALAGSVPAFAATYYVTPEGAGDKTGADWENAMGTAEFVAQAKLNADGDIYNLAGGVYTPSEPFGFKKATYAIINGSVKDGRTVLSGGYDGENGGSETVRRSLIRFQTNTGAGNVTKPAVINDVDFTAVYTSINSDPTADTSDTPIAGAGALYVDNSGCVAVNRCNFYGNTAAGSMGGPATHARRSGVTFTDCVFSDNSAVSRAGAVRLSSDNGSKGIIVFENCVFKNNKIDDIYGGAVFMSHGKSATFINTIFAGNECAADGAAVYLNSSSAHPCAGTFVSCTIAGNKSTGEAQDGQIVSTQYADIHMVNTVVVSKNDNTADLFFKSGAAQAKFSFVSGGYNYVGTVVDNVTDSTEDRITWLDTDRHGDDCTYSSIFGNNVIGVDNILNATTIIEGATGAQLTGATAEWGLPADADITKDIFGNERVEGVSVGAYAETEVHIPTGIEDVAADGKQALVSLGNGAYTIAGATSVEAYSVMGCRVATVAGDTVDLSAAAPGMYILKAGNKVFKVIK